jgi:two-component system, OmpR family, phosphate regulon response regulator OmpR
MPQPIPITDDAPHILLVDDDARIRTLMTRFLSGHGYRITAAGNAQAARAFLELFVFDMLVLDVMMPGESGLELAQSLRQTLQTPIIMLTARGEIDDRISGLEAGADDYMGKPFEPRELLLRIKSLLRRVRPQGNGAARSEVVFGPFQFDTRTGELKRGDEIIRITERERDILRILSASEGGVVARQALAGATSAADIGASDRAVDVQINRLRRKIEVDPAQPMLLQTVRGLGYKLMVDV